MYNSKSQHMQELYGKSHSFIQIKKPYIYCNLLPISWFNKFIFIFEFELYSVQTAGTAYPQFLCSLLGSRFVKYSPHNIAAKTFNTTESLRGSE